ncbi:MAG: tripartite tricarboxylate transporter substrate binding protein, partial [Alphaproteobacteria bacterium]|nr:tripartite tricarboxylate transporter substrate binding protein [Alphaproteobacteria bacterium]
MTVSMRRILAGALMLFALVGPAVAQSDYPNRTIRMVVGFAAGGGNDIFARLVGAKLSDLIG